MQKFSAEEFRRKLAGLETPETRFSPDDVNAMKQLGVQLVLALREVFGSGLDRKTLWERISNGIPLASSKSGGRGEKFLVELLDYVKSEANVVVGSEKLRLITASIMHLSPESQRQFIRICVEYRMLLCLEAREEVLASE